jgi:hypothetical protein
MLPQDMELIRINKVERKKEMRKALVEAVKLSKKLKE